MLFYAVILGHNRDVGDSRYFRRDLGVLAATTVRFRSDVGPDCLPLSELR